MKHLVSDEHGTREATAQEIELIDIVRSDYEASRQTELAQLAARKSAITKLAALGLTEAEITALLGVLR